MSSLLAAVEQMLRTVKAVRGIARAAHETESRVDLHPSELWEPVDEARLLHLEIEIRKAKGEQPLF